MSPVVLRILTSLYRVLLRLYPASFRARFGAGMVRAFADGIRGRAAVHGSISALAWVARTLAGAVAS